jgi:hypothetical protein
VWVSTNWPLAAPRMVTVAAAAGAPAERVRVSRRCEIRRYSTHILLAASLVRA